MASQLLCDLDTQQTVCVASEGRYGNRLGQDWSQPQSGSLASSPQTLSTDWGGQSLTADSDTDAASLLWLLDYRLDHLLSPGGASCGQQTQQYQQQHHQHQQHHLHPQRHHHHHQQQHHQQQEQYQRQCQQHQQHYQRQRHQHQHQQDGSASQARWDAANLQTVPQEATNASQERKPDEYRTRDAGKPPFTYTELIEQALLEEGQLTVSGIYRWITSHFSFYKSCDDRWKNSVRHNLSMNPYFRKGSKAASGTGRLWTLAEVGGRRVRRCFTAGRMGRPPQTQPTGGGTAAETSAPEPLSLELCEDIPLPSQEIWLCSSPPEDRGRPVSPGPAPDAGFIVQYCTYPPEVAATVELTPDGSVDCELNNNNGGYCSDGRLETQMKTSIRNDNQLSNHGQLTGDHQPTTSLYS